MIVREWFTGPAPTITAKLSFWTQFCFLNVTLIVPHRKKGSLFASFLLELWCPVQGQCADIDPQKQDLIVVGDTRGHNRTWSGSQCDTSCTKLTHKHDWGWLIESKATRGSPFHWIMHVGVEIALPFTPLESECTRAYTEPRTANMRSLVTVRGDNVNY